ncbi:unnamed protein product [Calypogeia fissa]
MNEARQAGRPGQVSVGELPAWSVGPWFWSGYSQLQGVAAPCGVPSRPIVERVGGAGCGVTLSIEVSVLLQASEERWRLEFAVFRDRT